MTERAVSPDERANAAFAWSLLGLAGIDLVVYAAGGIGALVVHGRWPPVTVRQAVAVALRTTEHPGRPALAWPVPDRGLVPGPVAVYLVLTVLAVGLATVALVLRRATGRGRRAGLAHRRELRAHLSRGAVRRRASQVRPGLRNPTRADPTQLGVRLGRGAGDSSALWASLEDSFLVLGPPRSNKTAGIVIPRVIDAPGAVVVTSIRPEILRHTAWARTGPTHVFDPQDSAHWPSPLRWSPVSGCEDPLVAIRRARGFAEGAGPGQTQSADAEFFNRSATAVIRCYLQAAALAGLTMTEVVSWAGRPQDEEAMDILSGDRRATPGWARTLAAASTWDPRTRDGIWATVARAFDSLADPRVLAACSPAPGEEFSPQTFLATGGTLHVIGSPETQLSLAPLISAFVEDLVEVALETAAASDSGRLDPPLSLWLDEAANIAPLEALPQLLSAGGGSGICTAVVLQSLAQARSRWGSDKADAIWDASTVRIVFGGLGHAEDLARISRLAGEVDEQVRSHTRSSNGSSWSSAPQKRPALPIDYLRTLPEGRAVVLHRRTPPVEAVFDPWWKLPVADAVHASKERCKALARAGAR